MSRVLDIGADDWEKEILKFKGLVVVEFWHERCQWCKKLGPIYSEVAEEYEDKVKFVKLNVLVSQANQKIAVNYGIMGTPTLIFLCDGRPVETILGFQTKERLKQLVDDVIGKHRECVEKSTELKTA